MMQVLALVPYPPGQAPGQRYRIEQWAPLLGRDGIAVTFSPFLSVGGMQVLYEPGHFLSKAGAIVGGYAKRVINALRSPVADVVFLYREAALLAPAWIERRLMGNTPLVFDFDDAIYLNHTSEANAWSRRLKPRHKAAELCTLARHVTVGNSVLATFAEPHARALTIIPSTIDTDVYQMRARPPNRVPVIGWTGSQTTLPYLRALVPVLRALRTRRRFELRIIGARATFDGLDVTCVPWRATSEPDDLRVLDIGLMPLLDDEWSRGKCGMKALQYMALGIPPVVSPVGANATIVQDGVNGFWADTTDEWIDRLSRLLEDDALRDRLGRNARVTVETMYSARMHAPRLARVLEQAAT
jgi:glycosyltransferase involved in cell wall biosynthesis